MIKLDFSPALKVYLVAATFVEERLVISLVKTRTTSGSNSVPAQRIRYKSTCLVGKRV